MIAGILLAAGRGRRSGSNKLLMSVGGWPLVARCVRNCLASRLPRLHVVVGTGDVDVEEAVRRAAGDDTRIHIVRKREPDQGMMGSLKMGIRSLADPCRAMMVLLADMPLVTAQIIDNLLDAFDRHARIIVPECEGEVFHPRIIPARFFPEFLRLDDDDRGTHVLDRHRGAIYRLKFKGRHHFIDVDRRADLKAIVKHLEADPGSNRES
jgi:molybdenum cofactor cytidylyltransferase